MLPQTSREDNRRSSGCESWGTSAGWRCSSGTDTWGANNVLAFVNNQQYSFCPVPALGVHVHGEVLEDVHVAAVGDGADAGTGTLSSDELDGLGAHIPINKIVGK